MGLPHILALGSEPSCCVECVRLWQRFWRLPAARHLGEWGRHYGEQRYKVTKVTKATAKGKSASLLSNIPHELGILAHLQEYNLYMFCPHSRWDKAGHCY